MKRIALLIFFCLAIGFSANAKWYTTTHEVYLRAGAGTNYKVLFVIPQGTSVDISEVSGSWGKTQYKNGIAFISTKYLKELPPNNSQEKPVFPFIAVGLVLIAIFAILRFFYRGFLKFLSFFGFNRKKTYPNGYTLIGDKKIPNEDLPKSYIKILERIKALEELKSKHKATERHFKELQEAYDDFNTAVKLSQKMK